MFKNTGKFLLITAPIILLLALSFTSAQAITSTGITITGGADNVGDCGVTFGQLNINVTVQNVLGTANDSGAGEDEFFVAVFDTMGKHIGNWIDNVVVGTTQNFAITASNFVTIPGITAPTTRTIRAALIDSPDVNDNTVPGYLNNAPVATSGWFDIGGFSAACAALPAGSIPAGSGIKEGDLPPDNRLNWHFGDGSVAVLYPRGTEAVDVYIHDTQQYVPNFVTPDDLEVYADNPPEQNTLLRKVGRIAVYILTTGQIQFNFGPDVEGKEWVFIMDGLDDRQAEDSYYFDPNE